MISEKRIISSQNYNKLFIICIFLFGIVSGGISAVADQSNETSNAGGNDFPTLHGTITTGYPDIYYWNPYAGWDQDLISTAGFGLYPSDIGIWDETETEPLPPPDSSVDHWVKLAFFPAGSEPGQPGILSGYVGGRNFNAEVTLAGKQNSNDVFHKIITIRPQENGVFVWAIPDDLAIVQFYQATASVGGIPVTSEIVSTSLVKEKQTLSADPSSAFATDTAASSSSVPDTASTAAPVPTGASALVSTASSLTVITYLTLSADNLRPDVGQEVILSGSLTGNGRGVPGATISIEVPDYGTDFLPLISTTTDGDGRFSATINTWEGGVVPVRAVFKGDDKYQPSTSNTLTFTAGNFFQ